MNNEEPNFYNTRTVLSWLSFIAALSCIGLGVYTIESLSVASIFFVFGLSVLLFILAFKTSPEPDSFIRQIIGETIGNIIFQILLRLILWPFKLLLRLFDGI